MADHKQLTPKQKLFLEALTSEEAMGDLRIAMRIAGYSDNTKIAHTAKALRLEIKEAAETLLAMYAPKAAFSLVKLLDEPNDLNARNILGAAKEILDRTGLSAKSSTRLEFDATSSIVILPPKQPL